MSELKEGEEFLLDVELTERMVADFIRLSGDSASLHTDASLAGSQGFEGALVHGALPSFTLFEQTPFDQLLSRAVTDLDSPDAHNQMTLFE